MITACELNIKRVCWCPFHTFDCVSLFAIVLLMLVTSESIYPLCPPTPGVGVGGGGLGGAAAVVGAAAAAALGASGGGTERNRIII